MTLELNARAFEFLPQFAKVVDLAVEDDPVAADRILHGLVPERREVDDGEAGVSEAYVGLRSSTALDNGGARVVRSTMSKAF